MGLSCALWPYRGFAKPVALGKAWEGISITSIIYRYLKATEFPEILKSFNGCRRGGHSKYLIPGLQR
jgi:hypothetical protein